MSRRTDTPRLTTPSDRRPITDTGPRERWTPDLIADALTGDPGLARRLIRELTPVVRARVTRRLRRSGVQQACGEARYERDDLCQEVFAKLFERDGRILRQWSPAKGLSLENFVGLVTERQVGSLLRPRASQAEAATGDATLEQLCDTGRDDLRSVSAAEQREMLDVLRRLLSSRVSKLGMAAYQLIFVEERSVAYVAERLEMNAAAVYAWRSRLRRQLRLIATQLELAAEPDWRAAPAGTAVAV